MSLIIMNLIISYKTLFPNITLLKVLLHKSYYLTFYTLYKTSRSYLAQDSSQVCVCLAQSILFDPETTIEHIQLLLNLLVYTSHELSRSSLQVNSGLLNIVIT